MVELSRCRDAEMNGGPIDGINGERNVCLQESRKRAQLLGGRKPVRQCVEQTT